MEETKNTILAKLCFILAFIGSLVFLYNLKSRIVVVHSLSAKDKWALEFNEGFHKNFLKKNHAMVSYQYLDSQFNLSEINKLKIGVLARQAIDQMNPGVLVFSGTNAQELLGRVYVNIPGKKIIFCNLNKVAQKHNFEDARNVTSILAYDPTQAIKELISLLVSKKETEGKIKIIVLGDSSSLSKMIKQTFSLSDWEPYSLIDLIHVNTFDEWTEAILSSNNKADILLIASYGKIYSDDTQKIWKNPQELIQWTVQNSRIPVIGTLDSFVDDGGDIALIGSPLGQGEVAARIAYRLLHGENALDIPPVPSKDYLIYLSPQPKNPHVAQLPSIYSAFAQTIRNFGTAN